ncbi:bestrophin family protein [Altericista sp. CCNU0014]|uniref:bestrophin family protein n=1 Tax=Altericista sp. CCNU0014 TaxID=3082949 RepID=UPI00384EFD20
MGTPNLGWVKLTFQVKGSVIPAVFPKALFCGSIGAIVSMFYGWGWIEAWPILGNVVPSIVLGLLLVFRTNTAYDRFWEGRKAWGTLVNTIRNLTRRIWVFVDEEDKSDRAHKTEVLYLILAFAIATKLHLRQEPLNAEVLDLVGDFRRTALQTAPNAPLKIAFWIEDYLQQQYQLKRVDLYQVTTLNALLDKLVDSLGICERILKTPIPMAYAIHLKQLLLIYCLLLPLQLVGEISYWTGPIVALISFTLFGIEEIGIEIENPFGRDRNDLPLDAICNTMRQNIEHLVTLRPSAYHRLE